MSHHDREARDGRIRSRLLAALWILVALALCVGIGLRAGMTRGLLAQVDERLEGRATGAVLRIWDWWAPSATESYARYFGELEREFERTHPDVDVVYQFVPFQQYEQKMATSLVGNSPPDVFQSSVSWAEGFYDRGMLLRLNGYLERERAERERRRARGEPVDPGQIVEREAFLQPAWRHNTKPDGTVFGIPQILDSACLIWNLDILEKAARADPEIGGMFVRRQDSSVDWDRIRWDAVRDWEQFRRIARKLTRRDPQGNLALNEHGDEAQTGFYIQAYGTGTGPFDPWCAANGGQFQDAAGTRAMFASEEGVEAIRFLLALYWKDRVCPAFRRNMTDYEVFEQRRTACMLGGTWSGKYIVRDTEGWKRFALTAFPPRSNRPGRSGNGGEAPHTTLTWGNMLVISSRSPHPDLAWEYIKFVASLPGALRLLRQIEQNSPRKDFYETGAWTEACRRLPYLSNVAATCASGKKLRHTQINAVDDQVKPIFETLLLRGPAIEAGGGPYPSLEAGLRDAARRVNRVYRRYNAQVALWRQKRSSAAEQR